MQGGTPTKGKLSFERKIEKPIIIIGCARSGTTLLGRALAQHSSIAYLLEPRPIWMRGNAYKSEYALGPDDVTPRIARYIDNSFYQFLQERGKDRFAEKTPSNCLRVPFIHTIYPDCRIIHIIRDGRNVVRSLFMKQEKPPKRSKLKSRLKETAIWEWPAYAPKLWRMVWRPLVMKKRPTYWGPHIPGWRDLVGKPPHVVSSHVWNETVRIGQRDGAALPSENYLEIRFEEMTSEPQRVFEMIEDFANLPRCREMMDFALKTIDPTRKGRWSKVLTDEQELEALEIMRPRLIELGYMTEGEAGTVARSEAQTV